MLKDYGLTVLSELYYNDIPNLLCCIYPETFNKEMFKKPEKSYLDLFGEYEKLELVTKEEAEDSKWLIVSDELNKIFKSNPNTWKKGGNSFDKIFKNSYEEKFIERLLFNEFTVYRYKLDNIKNPTLESEIKRFDLLWDYSRARYDNVAWLYWNAYNFFKDRGYCLRFYSDSTYMGLSTFEEVSNDYYNESHEFYKDDNFSTNGVSIPKYLNRDIKTVVRCGEIDVSRVESEFLRGCDYIWIIPFNDIDTTSTYAYLIEKNINVTIEFHSNTLYRMTQIRQEHYQQKK